MKKNFWPLLATIFNDALNYGIVVIVFAPMLVGKHALFFQTKSVSFKLTLLALLFSIFPLGQLLSAPVFGAFADMIGRKKTLITTLWGSFISNVLTGISIMLGQFWLLFISRFLAGGFSGNAALAQASIADMSKIENKARNLSYTGMAGSIAWIVGVPLGGFLMNGNFANDIRFSLPLWLAAFLFFITVIWMYFGFQETFVKNHSEARGFKDEFKDLSLFFKSSRLRYPLIFVFFFYFGWFIYLLYYPTYFVRAFQFTATQLSYYGAVSAIFWFLGSQFTKVWSMEKNIIEKGILSALVILMFSFLPIAFLDHPFWVICCFLVSSFCGAVLWILTLSAISNLSDGKHQGKAFGVIQFLQSISVLIAPLIANTISVSYMTLPFYLSIFLFLVGFLIFYFLYNRNNKMA